MGLAQGEMRGVGFKYHDKHACWFLRTYMVLDLHNSVADRMDAENWALPRQSLGVLPNAKKEVKDLVNLRTSEVVHNERGSAMHPKV